jgi:acetyl/propionyl-CoA carboxylase alpha subunit
VTECVTGVDLVHAQIRIAGGEPLWLRQEDISQRGHAVECRIYAEDPENDHLPVSGTLLRVVEPWGPGVRIDSGVTSGSAVGHHYDPLVAKLIAWAEDRPRALARMDRALSRYVLLGLTTNVPFLRDVIRHPVFQRGEATTRFVDEHFATWRPRGGAPGDEVFVAAALASLAHPAAGGPAPEAEDPHSPWRILDRFRLGGGP